MEITTDYLHKLRFYTETLNRIKERKEAIRQATEMPSINFSGTKVSGGARFDRYEYMMERLEKLDTEYTLLVNNWEERYQNILIAIDNLPYPENVIMEMKYLDGKKWSQISDKLNLSASQCQLKHTQALTKLGITNTNKGGRNKKYDS